MKAERLSLLAVFAHPDDETFRPGGTLALLARSGVQVHILTATRGQAGSCGDPPLCRPEELPSVRENELRCACRALGLEQPQVLDYVDGRLAEENPELITAKILTVIEETSPQVMLTFGPDGLSGHSDHITAGSCAHQAYDQADRVAALYTLALPRSLVQKLGMTQVQSVPDEEISIAVDVSPVWEYKRRAIQCHATQHASSPLLQAAPERQQQFFCNEYFVRAEQRCPEKDFMEKYLKDIRSG